MKAAEFLWHFADPDDVRAWGSRAPERLKILQAAVLARARLDYLAWRTHRTAVLQAEGVHAFAWLYGGTGEPPFRLVDVAEALGTTEFYVRKLLAEELGEHDVRKSPDSW